MTQRVDANLNAIFRALDHLESTSYSGMLTWKITNWARYFNYASHKPGVHLNSPEIHTGPYGYRMRAYVYLFFDVNGRDNHLGVGLNLLKGKFDAILDWPIEGVVKFTLYDQSPQQEHLVTQFNLRTGLTSFARPARSESDPPGASIYFVPMQQLYLLNKYIRDDTMYINIDISSSNF